MCGEKSSPNLLILFNNSISFSYLIHHHFIDYSPMVIKMFKSTIKIQEHLTITITFNKYNRLLYLKFLNTQFPIIVDNNFLFKIKIRLLTCKKCILFGVKEYFEKEKGKDGYQNSKRFFK